MNIVLYPRRFLEASDHTATPCKIRQWETEKWGKRSIPRVVLLVAYLSKTVSIIGSGDHRNHTGLYDVQAALVDDELTVMVMETVDQLDNALRQSLSKATEDTAVHPSAEHIRVDCDNVKSAIGDEIEVLRPSNNILYRVRCLRLTKSESVLYNMMMVTERSLSSRSQFGRFLQWVPIQSVPQYHYREIIICSWRHVQAV